MLVVSDLNKMFRPFSGDLLVDVADRRAAIEAFLDAFPSMHAAAFHDEARFAFLFNLKKQILS